MRILVVSQYFWPENFRINDLVKELGKRGHQVTVLTGVPNYPTGKVFSAYLITPDNFTEYEGAKVVRVPMFLRGNGNFRLMLNYLSFVLSGCVWGMWCLRNIEVDVIFVFEPSPVTVGLPAVMLSKIKQAPVVFWALDLWPETLAAVGAVKSILVLRLVGLLVSFIYNRCTLVLGQSRGFLASISNYCSDKTKVRYFPSWAEEVFLNTKVMLAPEIPEVSNMFTIMFAGNIGEAQDMPAVLAAAESLKAYQTIRWIILGDGRKSEWLKSEVIKRGLQDRVFMLGRFDLERMPSFYAHADALLVSLKRNSLFNITIPGKLQSYLQFGTPVIGMLDGEGAAVIREAKVGLTCDAGDSVGLEKAVLALANMPLKKRKRLGVNGQIYSEKEFGRTKLMGLLDELLSEAVKIHSQEN